MRRAPVLLALSASTALISGFALAPSALGTTRPARPATRPATVAKKAADATCRPKFAIANAGQKLGNTNDNTIGAGLDSIAAADKKHAYAVGVIETEDTLLDTETVEAIVDSGNGKKWTLHRSAGGSLQNKFFFDIAATNNNNVWATGFAFANSKFTGVVLQKNKSGWHQPALPHNKMTLLFSVATNAPDDVYVAGTTSVTSGDTDVAFPVVYHFNGKKWTRTVFGSYPGEGVSSMTFAGKIPVVAINNRFGSDEKPAAKSTVKYLRGSTWKTLAFPAKLAITKITGSSLSDLWATTEDKSQNPTSKVFHHTTHWTHTTLPDNEPGAISEHSRNPESIWVAGDATSRNDYGALDVIKKAGSTPGSFIIPGASFSLDSIDASRSNRILAAGSATESDGSIYALIEQANC